MISGHFLKAIFKPINFFLLLASFSAVGIAGFLGFYSSGISINYAYIAAAAALSGFAASMVSIGITMRSSDFIMDCRQADRIGELQKLNKECRDLYSGISRKVGKNTKNRMHTVLKQKNELLRCLKDYIDDPVKQTVAEQSLRLVMAYFSLTYNFSIRSMENSEQNVKEIEQRINYNNRRLGALKSYDAVLELVKSIEMDEKLVKSMKEENHELERISAKLNYIESTISVFKHRIMSSDSSDPEFEEIEQIINEATALDNVLNERKKIHL